LVAGLLLTGAATLQTSTPTGRATGATWDTTDTPPPDADAADATGDAGDQPAGLPLPAAERPGDEPFFEVLTPDPLQATEDVPAFYELDCDSSLEEAALVMCEFGDLDGDLVVAVVGDSKIGQWMPALEVIAAERGWLLRLYTKSGCSFTSAMTERDGAPYTECHDWSEELLGRLTGGERADVLVTSSIRAKALDGSGDRSEQALVEGYADYWTTLEDHGTRVVAISDTPQPPEDDVLPYECVLEHPLDVASACSWPSDDGIGSGPLRAAVDRVDTATYVDMNPWVCPERTCVAAYRNVVTYRQGSHITATFVGVLAEPLAAYLVPVVEDAGGDSRPGTSS
jgi:hypothetical protein